MTGSTPEGWLDPLERIGVRVTFRKTARAAHQSYLLGYLTAIYDFGVWKDGVQTIGIKQEPIKLVFAEFARAQTFVEDVTFMDGD